MNQTPSEFAVKCKRCDKDIYYACWNFDTSKCEKDKCPMKREKARKQAAIVKQCHPDDFLPVIRGCIAIHKEDEKASLIPAANEDNLHDDEFRFY